MFRRIGGRFESFQHFGMGSMCGIRSVYKGSKYYHTEIGKYLASLDGQGYGRLKNLEGKTWNFAGGLLEFSKIQSDPFAPPSLVTFSVTQSIVNYPEDTFYNEDRRNATEDYVYRRMYKLLRHENLQSPKPSQSVLKRSDINISSKELKYRFAVQFPSVRGRRISGKKAAETLETYCESALLKLEFNSFTSMEKKELYNYIHCYLDQIDLRKQMKEQGIISFIRNGAILPRESGIVDTPLKSNAIPFSSPSSLEKTFQLPYSTISGMAIPRGITIIVGGGFHGKSTVMDSIKRGIYNHIPGDGREYVVTDDSAVDIRAEDGRNIQSVDISNFISNLPGNIDTSRFSTKSASGSTSQAANIVESIEMNCKVLLIDEDKTATNFMCRDRFMSKLISQYNEPITPFISKAKSLFKYQDVSSILVVGGLGEYFSIADNVILMDNYYCKDVTETAKNIINEDKGTTLEQSNEFKDIEDRIISKETWKSLQDGKIKNFGMNSIKFGNVSLDISGVYFEEASQIKELIHILRDISKRLSNSKDKKFKDLCTFTDLHHSSQNSFHTSKIRSLELAAVLNRYYFLKINN